MKPISSLSEKARVVLWYSLISMVISDIPKIALIILQGLDTWQHKAFDKISMSLLIERVNLNTYNTPFIIQLTCS